MGGSEAVAARLEVGAVTFKEFRNALCILRSIDKCELEEAGVLDVATHNESVVEENKRRQRWMDFKDNPYDFLLRTDDETTDKLWALMIKRGVEPDLSGAWRGR